VDIGIAYDLKQAFSPAADDPEDRLEEYDSQATVDAIRGALEARGHEVRLLGGGRGFIEAVLARPPDLVFNIAEGYGTRSREAHVPSVLEMLHVPVTHSDPLTLAVTLDKAVAKRLVSAVGLSTPRFAIVESLAQLAALPLTPPLMTKPLFEGSSMGIRRASRVADGAALRERVARLIVDYHQPVLVEEFCPGPEFTVGVVGNGAEARPLGVMEIIPRRDRLEEFVYSLEVKRNYLEEVEYHVPPRRPAALIAAIEQLALGCYRALGCRDIARVDIRVGADGEPKFLEVNPLPGLHPVTGDIVIIAERSSVPYVELIGGIVDHARGRYGALGIDA
jgi:D-alanine-D-alanine ligase